MNGQQRAGNLQIQRANSEIFEGVHTGNVKSPLGPCLHQLERESICLKALKKPPPSEEMGNL